MRGRYFLKVNLIIINLMKNLAKKVRHYHVVSALVVGGIAFAAFNFSGSNQPVFDNHANFVLLAKEKINLASDVTVSS
ncbi:MAG: hypothetical protein COU46_03150, partial [Candidatus Niyogibacteria bacterium CG10_big_fil_rev_8_21_14_0_10_42_19]